MSEGHELGVRGDDILTSQQEGFLFQIQAHPSRSLATDRGADARATEGGSRGDDPLQFLVHTLLTMTRHDQPLFLELLGHVARTGARDFNPRLGEEGAGDQACTPM